MVSISIEGPYPKCNECPESHLVPVVVDPQNGLIKWKCTGCGRMISKETQPLTISLFLFVGTCTIVRINTINFVIFFSYREDSQTKQWLNNAILTVYNVSTYLLKKLGEINQVLTKATRRGVTMDAISLGEPFPPCEKCKKGYLPVKVAPEIGNIEWICSNCGRTIPKERP